MGGSDYSMLMAADTRVLLDAAEHRPQRHAHDDALALALRVPPPPERRCFRALGYDLMIGPCSAMAILAMSPHHFFTGQRIFDDAATLCLAAAGDAAAIYHAKASK